MTEWGDSANGARVRARRGGGSDVNCGRRPPRRVPAFILAGGAGGGCARARDDHKQK